jgi:hypothetical protein
LSTHHTPLELGNFPRMEGSGIESSMDLFNLIKMPKCKELITNKISNQIPALKH